MATLTLTDKGKSAYRIVIPAQPIPAEQYAAEELQRYLERISGVKLPIVTDVEPAGKREIFLGDNAHLRTLQLGVDWAKLGSDGFLLATKDQHLIIAGGRPRGTLYGVYALLEEQLGVRWFTATVESVPRKVRVRIPELNSTQVPIFEYREDYWTEAMRDGDFSARLRMNGPNHHLEVKHGGPAVTYYPFVHSLDALIPQSLYKDHPDYFPLIDGKRESGYVQRCLSNPDVVKLALTTVRQWIKDHPEANIISISQNDTGKWCQCPQCKALDDTEGSPAASLLKFVNSIAEQLEPEYPNIRYDTLAYQYTRKPPATIHPRRNVIMRLCSIECCFAHPFTECASEENRRFREDTLAWEKVAPRIYVWDYTTDFANYLQPFPDFDALQGNLRFFAAHGVKGVFEQGNYSPGGAGELAPLRAYVLAKLLWDPETDVQRHVDEFLRGYYGKSADAMAAFLLAMHQPVRGQGSHVHIFDPPTAAYLSDAMLAEADCCLDRTEQLADNDEVKFRVQTARLPIWYVKIATGRVKDDERVALVKQFLAVARKAGVTHINEWKALDQWAKEMGAE